MSCVSLQIHHIHHCDVSCSRCRQVKRTTKVKVFTEQTRVHKSCLERTKWNKFGLAAQVGGGGSVLALDSLVMVFLCVARVAVSLYGVHFIGLFLLAVRMLFARRIRQLSKGTIIGTIEMATQID